MLHHADTVFGDLPKVQYRKFRHIIILICRVMLVKAKKFW